MGSAVMTMYGNERKERNITQKKTETRESRKTMTKMHRLTSPAAIISGITNVLRSRVCAVAVGVDVHVSSNLSDGRETRERSQGSVAVNPEVISNGCDAVGME